ncbi:MAG: hypothetical protein FH756_01660 [Firmicutes bacterium]|nr:hypothetical protein [Bacillota bacterium]
MGITEALQGPLRNRQGETKAAKKATARKKTGQTDLWLVPRLRPKSTAERFRDPIMKVDIQTGQVYINRMDEHWAGRRYS